MSRIPARDGTLCTPQCCILFTPPDAGARGPRSGKVGLAGRWARSESLAAVSGSDYGHAHRLHSNAAWSGEAIPKQLTSARKEACLETLILRLHSHGLLFVNPCARFNVYLLARSKSDFEHIAVTVQPNNAFLLRRKRVDPESRATKHEVCKSLDPSERILDPGSSSQELVFAYVDDLTLAQMNRKNVTGAVAAERNSAGTMRFRHKDRHSGEHTLECPRKGL